MRSDRKKSNWTLTKSTRKLTKDYTGKIFGFLKIVKFEGYNKNGRAFYTVEDIFGRKDLISSTSFYNKGFGSEFINSKSSNDRKLIWAVWQQMHRRCSDSSCYSFRAYGGRGIKVCKEWSGDEGALIYLKWAIASGWKSGLTIDRIDINGNYSPENCRFVSRAYNATWRRSTRLNYEIASKLRKLYSVCNISKGKFCKVQAPLFGVKSVTIRAVLNNHSWTSMKEV